MASDRPDDSTTPARRPAPPDADDALVTMGHDARNGLAAIVARAQMLARRLRRGGLETEDVARGLAEIERVAQHTARRIEAIERPFHQRRPGGPDDVPIGDSAPDHGDLGGP